jgi:hypothetical protein
MARNSYRRSRMTILLNQWSFGSSYGLRRLYWLGPYGPLTAFVRIAEAPAVISHQSKKTSADKATV